ncbi:MAG: ABC transporter ATP-binding protein/permease [Anaerolineaceae bacterium]|nr:ABC transporter ATP-binding protein/permease [Anaerolineaceae bacterium]
MTLKNSLNNQAWHYYIQFYKDSWGRLLGAIIVSMGQSLFILPIAFLVGHIFDQAIPQNDFKLLIVIGLEILFLQIASSAISLYVRNVSLKVTKAVIKQIREEILEHFYTFSQAYYSKADRSNLHTMAVQDTERLDIMSNALIAIFLPAFFVSIALMLALFYLDRVLSLILVFAGPFLFWLSRTLTQKIKQHVQGAQRSFEDFSKGILFVLQMIDLTRTFSAEQFEIQRGKNKIDQLHTISVRVSWLFAAYINIQKWIFSLAGILILVLGGWATAVGRITIGELIAFYFTAGLLRSQVNLMTSSVPQIIEGNESLVSLFNLLQTKSPLPYSGTKRIDFQGEIVIKDVDFQYDQEPILANINLRIPNKGLIAIAGPNAVGKSSLLNLVLGFYAPQKGELFADAHSYSLLDIHQLRRSFGVVHQDPILFQGTIRENIVYWSEELSEEDMVKSARTATAHDFIEKLPETYDTVIGERGVRLSGGERQRIAIARAFFRNPKILFLDEPTNHLDSNVKLKLIANIKAWSQNRVVVVISHHRDVIQQAQSVYHFEQGKITFNGPPDEYFRTMRS